MSNSEDKYHQILELFKELKEKEWSGSITFDLHRGNLSKKYKTVNTKLINPKSKY